jgi:hypothetical protein
MICGAKGILEIFLYIKGQEGPAFIESTEVQAWILREIPMA